MQREQLEFTYHITRKMFGLGGGFLVGPSKIAKATMTPRLSRTQKELKIIVEEVLGQ